MSRDEPPDETSRPREAPSRDEPEGFLRYLAARRDLDVSSMDFPMLDEETGRSLLTRLGDRCVLEGRCSAAILAGGIDGRADMVRFLARFERPWTRKVTPGVLSSAASRRGTLGRLRLYRASVTYREPGREKRCPGREGAG